MKYGQSLRVYTWQDEALELSKRRNLHDRIFKTAVIVGIALVLCLFLASTSHARELKASWYSHASLIKEGTRKPNEAQIMANAEPFNENNPTAASWDYPLGTLLRVTNKANGKSIVVKITDRTARRFKGKRIDLTRGMFQKLDLLTKGIILVDIERIL